MTIAHSPRDGGKLVCAFDAQGADYAGGDTFRPRFFLLAVPPAAQGRYLQFRYRVNAQPFNIPFGPPHWGRLNCSFGVNYDGTPAYRGAAMAPVMGEWTTGAIDMGGGAAPVQTIEITMGDLNSWDHFPDGSTIEFDWIRLTDDVSAATYDFGGPDIGPWNNTHKFFAPGNEGIATLRIEAGKLICDYSAWRPDLPDYRPFIYNSDLHIDARHTPGPLYMHARMRVIDAAPRATADPVITLQWDEGGDPTGFTSQTLPNDARWHTLTFDIASHPSWGTGWRDVAGGWRLLLGGNESIWQLFGDRMEIDYIVFSADPLPPLGAGDAVSDSMPLGAWFYTLENDRDLLRASLSGLLDQGTGGLGPRSMDDATTVPMTVELNLYQDAVAKKLFIDANNLDIDVTSDTLASTPALSFSVAIPAWLQGRPLLVSTVSPDTSATAQAVLLSRERARVTLPQLVHYTSVVLEGDPAAHGTLAVAPPALYFTEGSGHAVDVEQGETASTQTLTLANTGLADLTVTGLVLSGPRADDFTLEGAPALPLTLLAGAQAPLTVRFAPAAIQRTLGLEATLTVTSDDPDSPSLPIALLGDAVPVGLGQLVIE
jgi:hypothetical protein